MSRSGTPRHTRDQPSNLPVNSRPPPYLLSYCHPNRNLYWRPPNQRDLLPGLPPVPAGRQSRAVHGAGSPPSCRPASLHAGRSAVADHHDLRVSPPLPHTPPQHVDRPLYRLLPGPGGWRRQPGPYHYAQRRGSPVWGVYQPGTGYTM